MKKSYNHFGDMALISSFYVLLVLLFLLFGCVLIIKHRQSLSSTSKGAQDCVQTSLQLDAAPDAFEELLPTDSLEINR